MNEISKPNVGKDRDMIVLLDIKTWMRENPKPN